MHFNGLQCGEDMLFLFILLILLLSHEIQHIFCAFQLSNIIWGEAGEDEDHIVPYPDANEEKPLGSYGDCIKKEKHQEAVDIKTAEQKKPATQSDLHVKLECSSQYNANEDLSETEFTVDSWPDLSLPGAAKANEDIMGTETSNNVTDVCKHDLRCSV